jgi:hypothetical protein
MPSSEPPSAPTDGREPVVRRLLHTLDLRVPDATQTIDLWRDHEPGDHQLTTTLAAVTYGEAFRSHPGWLGIEAAGFTAVALMFGHAVGHQHAGIVAIFLASASLSSRFKQIASAAERGARGRQGWALVRGATVVLALFMGMLITFGAYAWLIGPTAAAERFPFAGAGAADTALHADRFRPGLGLVGHNLLVLLSAFVLAFVYRTFGALLALSWNACAWAVVVAAWADSAGGWWMVALLPHLLLEALAYALAGLAGIRAGVYILRRAEALGAVLWLLVWAIGLCFAAATIEMGWLPWILSEVQPSVDRSAAMH